MFPLEKMHMILPSIIDIVEGFKTAKNEQIGENQIARLEAVYSFVGEQLEDYRAKKNREQAAYNNSRNKRRK